MAATPCTTSPSPSVHSTPTIDLLFFPHIFDQIFEDASHDVLVKLRQTCHDLKARVDTHLGAHLVLWERTPLPWGLRALDGGQLPLLHGSDHASRAPDMSFLASTTRVLDIPGAVNPVAFDKLMRAMGTELAVIRTFDRHAMLLPSLRFAHARTYVRFLNLLPTDRHPCIPLGCRKVVVNVDLGRAGTGEDVLVDFAFMSRGVKELVVVFTQPPLTQGSTPTPRSQEGPATATNNILILSLAKAVGCHPWLLHQVLSLARYVPQHVGRLTFVNLFPHAPCSSTSSYVEDVRTLLARILSGRLKFSDCLLDDIELQHAGSIPAPDPAVCAEVERGLSCIDFVSAEEYAARVGPKTFVIETDSSAFRAYERQFEDARGVETARL